MSKTVLFTDFEYDFQLIGISSHVKDYRLSWELNKKLDIELVKENEVTFSNKKGDKSVFSMYFFQDDKEERDIRLMSNKFEGRLLIPEKKAADYFLLLYDFTAIEATDILRTIRKINVILTAFEVEVNTLKSKENLLF